MAQVIHTHAAILGIGDELVRGQTLDTNSKLLSERLMLAGIEPVEHVTVGDDLAAMTDALRRLCARAPLVVCTGGLGPTDDDLTRDALAAVLGDELIEDGEALAWLTERLRSRGREVAPNQRMQALRPRGAECLRNDFGTAPGLFATVHNAGGASHTHTDVFCLPGPPGELKPMWDACVAPRLRAEEGVTIRTRFLKVIGLPEAEAAARVPGIMARDASPQVGITASGGVLTWRIRYRGPLDAARADEQVEAAAKRIHAAMGEHIFADVTSGEPTLAARLVELLKQRGETLAAVESCTGGMLGQTVTAVAGSSAVFVGGCVTYSNELKQRLVGVRAETLAAQGAVSAECAAEMAAGGRQRTGADWCLSVTGIAGPEGGSEAKPVGTVFVGLAGPTGVRTKGFRFPGSREDVRQRSVLSALAMLYFAVVRGEQGGEPPAKLLWEVG
jgi:nicotinamide-nucleotide amidase